MSKIAFFTYEIHPTNRGGCGVLLHHAAEILLRQGHQVVFALAMPRHEFERFRDHDRLQLTSPERCRAYHVDELAGNLPVAPEAIPASPMLASLRFALACERLLEIEKPDAIEFFEYCGVGYYAFVRRLFGRFPAGATLCTRLHGALELLDSLSATRFMDRDRYHLHALERAALALSETVLTPTPAYFEAYCKDHYQIEPARAVVSQSPKLPFPRVSRRPTSKAPFTIAYVGRMFGFKGVDQLVHAAVELFRKRPDLPAVVDVIGPDAAESPLGGSYAEYLRSLVPGSMRDKFVFAGHQSHKEIVRRLDNALFAVFPNKFESFCYAAHEVYESGVPLIVNDIPAWRDFFTHGKNALVYDGRTDSLLAAMERMIDDDALRERLARPYAVAEEPLGDFYAAPKAAAPLVAGEDRRLPRVLAVVLGAEAAASRATIDALLRQAERPSRIVHLLPAHPERRTDLDETFWFLGKPWHIVDDSGATIPATEIFTSEAITILRAGDKPDPDWLKACATALRNRPTLGYAGTWARAPHPLATNLDLAPEAFPFEHGTATTRMVVRTIPGRLLVDLVDPSLGALGDIGNVWDARARVGPGAVLPEPLIELADPWHSPDPPEPALLKFLLARHAGPLAERLRIYTGLMHDQLGSLRVQLRAAHANGHVPPTPARLVEPTLDYKLRVADELGGSTLARMAFQKLTRRVMGKAPRTR